MYAYTYIDDEVIAVGTIDEPPHLAEKLNVYRFWDVLEAVYKAKCYDLIEYFKAINVYADLSDLDSVERQEFLDDLGVTSREL